MNVNEYGKTASGNQKPLGMVAPASLGLHRRLLSQGVPDMRSSDHIIFLRSSFVTFHDFNLNEHVSRLSTSVCYILAIDSSLCSLKENITTTAVITIGLNILTSLMHSRSISAQKLPCVTTIFNLVQ